MAIRRAHAEWQWNEDYSARPELLAKQPSPDIGSEAQQGPSAETLIRWSGLLLIAGGLLVGLFPF